MVQAITSSQAQDQFLKLLVAQLNNQNPLEPVGQQEFIQQLAQMSSLQGIEQLNGTFQQLLQLQQLTNGSEMLGKVATFQSPNSSELQVGRIDGVEVRDGILQVHINNSWIPLGDLQTILLPSAAA